MKDTLSVVEDAIKNHQQIVYADVNADKIVTLQSDKLIQDYFKEATIVNADGQAVIWAAKLFGHQLKERVTGVDLMQKLVELSANKKYKIYFLGAKEEVVSTLINKYEKNFGKEIIAGYRNGYFKEEEEKQIIKDITNSDANLLFVAITSPKKEIFLHKHKEALKNINFVMGVGGSFDVHAGFVQRAPIWVQKAGLEWLFRVYQEPGRMWKRYLISNTKFIILLFKTYLIEKK
ncbi:WecB/TagA/CpsF family glycosyltransferase [Empedobacter sp. 225-1]|uniref:WecB/TagA/CpsF family glycosyltransferase n=1 Tax=unclassified Empedobacter TaxID=2643773 RepID=UPI002578F740|nr:MULTISPECIES: WecB/TagA/CpsF family glycosyltransferase [unclassified Empedobacter]MDM1522352.1 WecB/TagA/CpsF family glycosyltransferase [Empedobacter sp. 225-1]MDM1541849.1 WecB/TagA/CpsF family glycosyltransferase [Empedobacter sp. 189-2]